MRIKEIAKPLATALMVTQLVPGWVAGREQKVSAQVERASLTVFLIDEETGRPPRFVLPATGQEFEIVGSAEGPPQLLYGESQGRPDLRDFAQIHLAPTIEQERKLEELMERPRNIQPSTSAVQPVVKPSAFELGPVADGLSQGKVGFRFEGIVPGDYILYVDMDFPEFTPPYKKMIETPVDLLKESVGYGVEVLGLTLAPGIHHTEVVNLRRSGLVRGVVVDLEGNPIPGIIVFIGWKGEERLSYLAETETPVQAFNDLLAETDRSGAFLIPQDITPDTPFVVTVQDREVMPSIAFDAEYSHLRPSRNRGRPYGEYLPTVSEELTVKSRETVSVRLVMEKGVDIEGMVVDEQGKPVSDAYVQVFARGQLGGSFEKLLSLEYQSPDPELRRERLRMSKAEIEAHTGREARSGEDGHFLVTNLPPGEMSIRVEAGKKAGYRIFRTVRQFTSPNNYLEVVLTPK